MSTFQFQLVKIKITYRILANEVSFYFPINKWETSNLLTFGLLAHCIARCKKPSKIYFLHQHQTQIPSNHTHMLPPNSCPSLFLSNFVIKGWRNFFLFMHPFDLIIPFKSNKSPIKPILRHLLTTESRASTLYTIYFALYYAYLLILFFRNEEVMCCMLRWIFPKYD